MLAHELAHFKLKHIPQRLVVGALVSARRLRPARLVVGAGLVLHRARRTDQPSESAALLLFMLVLPAFTWLVTPLFAAWSRRHEFEADAFAARYSDGPALAARWSGCKGQRQHADAGPIAFGFL